MHETVGVADATRSVKTVPANRHCKTGRTSVDQFANVLETVLHWASPPKRAEVRYSKRFRISDDMKDVVVSSWSVWRGRQPRRWLARRSSDTVPMTGTGAASWEGAIPSVI